MSKIDDSLSTVMDYIASLPNASRGKSAQLRAFFKSAKAILRGNDIYIIVLNNLVKKQLEKDIGLISEAVQESYRNPMLVVHIEIAQNFSLSQVIKPKEVNTDITKTQSSRNKVGTGNNLAGKPQQDFFGDIPTERSSTSFGDFNANNPQEVSHLNTLNSFSSSVASTNVDNVAKDLVSNSHGIDSLSNINGSGVADTFNSRVQGVSSTSQPFRGNQYLPPEMNTASGGANPSMYISSINNTVPNAVDSSMLRGYDTVWNGGRKLSFEEIQNNPYFKKNSIAKGKTFENFVEGPTNQILYENCKEIARNPGDNNLNPYLVYGESGLGKTHILLAIGNSIQKQYPNIKLMYVSMQQFFNDFTTALNDYKINRNSANSLINHFKNLYRSLDVLLLDDIQELERFKGINDEFIGLMNDLSGNQQLVFASSKHPSEMRNVVHKLRDRFASGVSIKVEPPDPDTRRRIILQKAKEVGIKLDKQSVEFITAKFASNIRILEGHIKTIAANIVGNRGDTLVTVNLVKSVLKDPLAAKAKLVTVDNIKQTVADYFRITVADIDSKARPRNIAHPRMLAMVLARELTGQSYPSLGKQFGGRDHTTVINAQKKIQKLCEQDVQMKEAYENMKLQLVD